jgi:hypothetical protein
MVTSGDERDPGFDRYRLASAALEDPQRLTICSAPGAVAGSRVERPLV